MKHCIFCVFCIVFLGQTAWAGRAPVQVLATDPYVSALLIHAESGKTLYAENEDAVVYPASVLKLMDLLVILDYIDQGTVNLDDMVQVTVEAYKMGGSQVYLDPKEQFTVRDLLYALMVQSANDAAVALAIHIAGSTENFVVLMNRKAEELGMRDTHFYSVHGLPPAKGQKVDVTTAHDFGLLALALSKRPEVYTYTGTRVRDFRNGEFIMRNHNHLLGKVEGCDGFKTGYFKAAGFSIMATAQRNGRRIIALVMGSRDRKVRDSRATELLARGFAMVPAQVEPDLTGITMGQQSPVQAKQLPVAAATPAVDTDKDKEALPLPAATGSLGNVVTAVVVCAVFLAGLGFFIIKKYKKKNRYRNQL